MPLAVSVFKERLKHREKDVVLRTLEVPPTPLRPPGGGQLALEGRLALMVACVLCSVCRAVARRRYQERSRKVACSLASPNNPALGLVGDAVTCVRVWCSVQYVGSKDFLSVLRKMVTNKKVRYITNLPFRARPPAPHPMLCRRPVAVLR